MLRAGLVALALVTTLAASASASAQQHRYRYGRQQYHGQQTHHSRPERPLTPEERAEVEARIATLEARCDEVGRARCIEEERARSRARLRALTRENLVLMLGGLGGLVAFVGWYLRRRQRRLDESFRRAIGRPAPGDASTTWDLVAIELALEARDAVSVRQRLDAIVGAHPDVRATSLPAVARTLADAPWTHVSLRQWPEAPEDDAWSRYRAVRAEIAGREQLEVRPDPGAGYRGEAATSAEGARLALVSLVVLARAEIPEQLGAPVQAARAALHRLASLGAADVVAVDLVWYPSAPGEATRERDLLARAPRLVASR